MGALDSTQCCSIFQCWHSLWQLPARKCRPRHVPRRQLNTATVATVTTDLSGCVALTTDTPGRQTTPSPSTHARQSTQRAISVIASSGTLSSLHRSSLQAVQTSPLLKQSSNPTKRSYSN